MSRSSLGWREESCETVRTEEELVDREWREDGWLEGGDRAGCRLSLRLVLRARIATRFIRATREPVERARLSAASRNEGSARREGNYKASVRDRSQESRAKEVKEVGKKEREEKGAAQISA